MSLSMYDFHVTALQAHRHAAKVLETEPCVCPDCGDEWMMFKGRPFKCPLCGAKVVSKGESK